MSRRQRTVIINEPPEGGGYEGGTIDGPFEGAGSTLGSDSTVRVTIGFNDEYLGESDADLSLLAAANLLVDEG